MGRDDQGLAQRQARYQVIPRTLSFITHGEEVLLLRGAPHKRLWAGRFNGVGGHVEPREDVYASALREIREECGLAVFGLRLRVVVHVDAGDPRTGILFFVFTATSPTKQVSESSEGTLTWVRRDSLPTAEMVEDLPILLPRVLGMGPDDPPFFALYRYDDADRLQVSFAALR